jgi:dihydropyrimidinase
MTQTLIKNGTIVNSTRVYYGDILVKDDKVDTIATTITPTADMKVIDAHGMLVLPGIIDAHTHIMLDTGVFKTADNWLVGSKAAIAGGVTTVVDFATQYPGQNFDEAVDQRLEEAKDSVVDYALHTMVTELPVGGEDALQVLVDRGLPSFKIYTTYRPNYYMDDTTILRLMRKATEIGGLVIVHAENDSMVTEATQHLVDSGKTGWQYHAQARPPEAEYEAINRVLYLAELADCPVYIFHVTTEKGIKQIKQANAAGLPAWCETCPQYLLLDDSVYTGERPEHYILQPPLRPPGEPEKVWQQVIKGAVSIISTDTCDYTLEQKHEFTEFTKTPGGLPGVETLLPLVYTYGVETKRIALTDMARLLCENPAKMFGLAARKGYLQPGYDADIVIYDPMVSGEIRHADLHYLSGYSPYEGMAVKGKVHTTISRGEVIYQNGEILATAGRGEFIPGEPFDRSAI